MYAMSPEPIGRRTRYEVRDATGQHLATHVRIDEPNGKKSVIWVAADGTKGLGGITPESLPLFGIERLGKESVVVVAEGEKAALALIEAGIPAVGTVTGASSTPGRAALAELTGRNVILWPDNDEVGFDHMRRIAAALKGIAATVKWVNWPEAAEHDDAFDCIARHGPEATRALLADAGPVPGLGMRFERVGLGYRASFRIGLVEMALDRIKTRSGQVHGELSVRSNDPGAPEDGHLVQSDFNVSSLNTRKSTADHLAKRAPKVEVDWQQMLEEFCRRVLSAEREGLPIVTVGASPKRDEVPYLVYPALPRDRATILFGPGGSGKSYIAVALAVSVSTGREVIGGWRPARPGRVLVLDWESDSEEWNDRISLVSKGIGVEPPLIDYRSCVVPLTEQVEEVSRYVSEHHVDLVIVDSVGMASPGGQQGTDANDATIRLFQALRVLKTTSLLVDHVSKAANEKESGAGNPYGSVFKVNLARQTWELRREEAENEETGDGHLVLVNRKTNNGPRRNPVGLRMEYGEDHVRFVREDVVEALQRNIPAPLIVERFLLRNGFATAKDIAEATNLPADTIRKACARGVERGSLVKDATGRYGVQSKYQRADADASF